MDLSKCVPCHSDSKNLLNPSKMFNSKACDYILLANNIEEEIALPKKITVDLNYLRSGRS